ncbi:hypothetical protein DV735_g3225, partial [Chaetothyriales sp. CBS 134920]
MQDELISMMCQHMQLNSIQQPPQGASMPSTPQVSPHHAPITYITQHYHHSGHQAPAEETTSSVLEAAGVNTSGLLPSQMWLFKNADEQQKQRLIELWLIAPPTPGNQFPGAELGNWPQTSMEVEEEAARRRWEAAEDDKARMVTSSDAHAQAEPYMVSLYSHLPHASAIAEQHEQHDAMGAEEYRHFKDPVYKSREWWKVSDEEPIEHQYGLLQAMMYGNGIEYPVAKDNDTEML